MRLLDRLSHRMLERKERRLKLRAERLYAQFSAVHAAWLAVAARLGMTVRKPLVDREE